VAEQAHVALEEANEAAHRSSYKLRRLPKKLDLMQIGSEAGSITRTSLVRKTDLPETADLRRRLVHPTRREGRG
jgi:hypothetical protein